MINMHRQTLVVTLLRNNFPQNLINLTIYVIHPFDDYPIPPRKLEKLVRKRSNEASYDLKSILDGQGDLSSWERRAKSYLEGYISNAYMDKSDYHVTCWKNVLKNFNEPNNESIN